jgi:ubiquinol-cytochrome c reductase cytochrome b subunit
MFRNFFTGAYRKPREFTWITGVALLMIALMEGYLGYSMLDDLLSGMGVRIISGLILSVPLIGTWLHWIIFGSEFEGDLWISRFFLGHVFLLPGMIMALIAVHLGLVWYLKHTQYSRPGARESNVVGERAVPGFGAKTLANALCVFGVLGLLGALFQINRSSCGGRTPRPPAPPRSNRIGISGSSSARCSYSRPGTFISGNTPCRRRSGRTWCCRW